MNTKDQEPVAWRALSEVQWLNIVNHDYWWNNYSKEDAVHKAVKMTEAICKKNNTHPADLIAAKDAEIADKEATIKQWQDKSNAFWDKQEALVAAAYRAAEDMCDGYNGGDVYIEAFINVLKKNIRALTTADALAKQRELMLEVARRVRKDTDWFVSNEVIVDEVLGK